MTVDIYHNPRCSKSRETLALLRTRGIEPTIIPYMDGGLTVQALDGLLKKLGLTPAALIRRKEALFRELDLGQADDATLMRAMAAHPRLIERPIVVNGARAALGRPPQAVLDIID